MCIDEKLEKRLRRRHRGSIHFRLWHSCSWCSTAFHWNRQRLSKKLNLVDHFLKCVRSFLRICVGLPKMERISSTKNPWVSWLKISENGGNCFDAQKARCSFTGTPIPSRRTQIPNLYWLSGDPPFPTFLVVTWSVHFGDPQAGFSKIDPIPKSPWGSLLKQTIFGGFHKWGSPKMDGL